MSVVMKKMLIVLLMVFFLVAGSAGYGVWTYKDEIPFLNEETEEEEEEEENNATPSILSVSTDPADSTVGINEEISFSSTADDEDNDPLTFSWDFGDNTTDSGQDLSDVSHSYSEVGTWTVTLEVSDGKSSDTKSILVFVDEEGSDVTTFLFEGEVGCLGDGPVVCEDDYEEFNVTDSDTITMMTIEMVFDDTSSNDVFSGQVRLRVYNASGNVSHDDYYEEGNYTASINSTDIDDGDWGFYIEAENGSMEYQVYIRAHH